MSAAPCVSIIIPAYNAASTIGAAIESVLGQTLSNLEVIVVDDGSQDDTVFCAQAIGDPRLRIIRADHGNVSRARNRGIDEARGEFITFLDADDLWTSGKLEAQVAALKSDPAACAVYSWTAFMDQGGRYLFAKAPQYDRGNVYEELLVTFFLASGSNVLARRECIEAIGRFDEAAQPVEDWEYWLRAAKSGPFAVVPEYHVLYRFAAGSASSAVDRYQQRIELLADRLFANAPPAIRARRDECIANARLHAFLLYLTRTTAPDSHQRAGRVLRSAIGLRPALLLSPRTLALAGAWMVLRFVPRRAMASTVHSILRLYGRWMMRSGPALRNLTPAARAGRT